MLSVLGGFGPARAVVNGSSASEGQFPFMAAITDATLFQFCGGTVIGSSWILTAAHCVVDEQASGLRVITGRTDLGSSGGQVLSVSSIHVSPLYDGNGNDVALLHLSSPTTSPAIRLSGSADNDLEADGAPVTTAGWGDTLPTEGLFSTNHLQYADLKVMGDSKCGGRMIGFDAATGVCANELLKDSCNGDSGGPLWAVKGGVKIQIGIVSYGYSCAIPEVPGVYSEVNSATIRSFISSTSGI